MIIQHTYTYITYINDYRYNISSNRTKLLLRQCSSSCPISVRWKPKVLTSALWALSFVIHASMASTVGILPYELTTSMLKRIVPPETGHSQLLNTVSCFLSERLQREDVGWWFCLIPSSTDRQQSAKGSRSGRRKRSVCTEMENQRRWQTSSAPADCRSQATICYDSRYANSPGRGCLNTPVSFFADILKTTARSAAVFGTPVHASFPHILQKFQTQATQGQVTRSRQVTSPRKKFEFSS